MIYYINRWLLVGKGYVYLVRSVNPAGVGQTYKIGHTTKLQQRINQLQPCELVAWVESDRSLNLEKELHEKFKHKRMKQSEWFWLDDRDVYEVRIAFGLTNPLPNYSQAANPEPVTSTAIDKSSQSTNFGFGCIFDFSLAIISFTFPPSIPFIWGYLVLKFLAWSGDESKKKKRSWDKKEPGWAKKEIEDDQARSNPEPVTSTAIVKSPKQSEQLTKKEQGCLTLILLFFVGLIGTVIFPNTGIFFMVSFAFKFIFWLYQKD